MPYRRVLFRLYAAHYLAHPSASVHAQELDQDLVFHAKLVFSVSGRGVNHGHHLARRYHEKALEYDFARHRADWRLVGSRSYVVLIVQTADGRTPVVDEEVALPVKERELTHVYGVFEREEVGLENRPREVSESR